MALGRLEPNDPPRAPWAIPLIVGLVASAIAVWRLSPTRDAITVALSSSAEIRGSEPGGEPADVPHPPPPPRCTELPAEPFILGDAPAPPREAGDAGTVDPGEEIEDSIAPFAVEIGRGTVFEGGFAAGARRDAEGGAVAMVATLGADGTGGKLVRLGRSRGDLDPPVVTGAGASVLAVLVEPNASGRALRVARVTGTEVTWGAEFSEGRDDSLAVDIAASGARAVVVWDDILGAPAGANDAARRSSVMLASFDVATMRGVTPARPISARSTDASSPRLITRPGGYWLAYLAHGEEDAAKKKARKHDDGKHDDEGEAVDQGEAITTGWIEVEPLDEGGTPTGAARAITPKSGHVLSFDLELGENGSALLAFRDDDTPTGSSGGKVSVALVRLGGGGEPRVLVEEAGSAGAPDLLPGWISLASVNGATRLAAMTPAGELLDELAPEPSLGTGEPIAATTDRILWARPMGKAMRLSVVRCRQRIAVDAGASEAGDGG